MNADLFEHLSYDWEISSCLVDMYITGLGDDDMAEDEQARVQRVQRDSMGIEFEEKRAKAPVGQSTAQPFSRKISIGSPKSDQTPPPNKIEKNGED